jgi:hypothetical protein
MLACPFCGAAETDRFEIEGQRFVVFACMFSPSVDPGLPDAEIGPYLEQQYAQGDGYFRAMCDRLHLHVTQGAGAKALRADASH